MSDYKTLETKILETTGIEEAPLVMTDRDIFKTITDALIKHFDKQADKNPEKALVLMKQLGAIVGFGVSKSNQSKGKSFRYELKKKR